MSPTLKGWFIGVLNAVISGAATGAGSLVAGLTVKQGLIVVAAAVVVSLSKWMLQHPIPGGVS